MPAVYPLTDGEWYARVAHNLSRGLPQFCPLPDQTRDRRSATVIATGPSAKHSLDEIRRGRNGLTLAVNGAYSWLVSNGIIPKGFMMIDPHEYSCEFVKPCRKDVMHVLASACHPKAFDILLAAGCQVMVCNLWHPTLMEPNHGLPTVSILQGGGSTVGLNAMVLCRALAHREIDVYGVDGCYSRGQHHAQTSHPSGERKATQKIQYAGRTYEVDDLQIAQAQDIAMFARMFSPLIRAKFHGPGLAGAIWKKTREDLKRERKEGRLAA